jgi:uncharacterized membrane protein
MSNTPIEQRPGESRAAYVARVTATIEHEWAGSRRVALDSRTQRLGKRAVIWFFRHWLWLYNLFNALLLVMAFASPLAYAQGWNGMGSTMFGFLSIFCTQVPTHSYYLLDYQIALCQRNLAMYGAMFLGGLYYAWLRRTGRDIRPLPLRWFVVLAAPLVIDGFTQLFGWRQSSLLLRTVTGALFGFAAVASIYPWFDQVRNKLWAVWGVEENSYQGSTQTVEEVQVG